MISDTYRSKALTELELVLDDNNASTENKIAAASAILQAKHLENLTTKVDNLSSAIMDSR